jgi:hypothetical protein
MPQAWIHQLSKQEVEELSSLMGLATTRMLDEMRKRVKDKWTAIEAYLPSQSADGYFPGSSSAARVGPFMRQQHGPGNL